LRRVRYMLSRYLRCTMSVFGSTMRVRNMYVSWRLARPWLGVLGEHEWIGRGDVLGLLGEEVGENVCPVWLRLGGVGPVEMGD
jgi:hypothetical protein